MNKENAQSLGVGMAIIGTSIFLWYIGSKEFASGLIGLLAGRIIDLYLVRKGEDPQLTYRSQELTEPLQKIHEVLSYSRIWDVKYIFETGIRDKGMLNNLKKDSSQLPQLIEKLDLQVEKDRKEADTIHSVEFSLDPNADFTDAWRQAVSKDEDTKKLIEEIKAEISKILSKYGGAG